MKNVTQNVKKSKFLTSNDIFIFCESYGEAFHPTSPSAHYHGSEIPCKNYLINGAKYYFR
jgi:hypothetical protein